jgi:hypothetical protein
MLGPGVWVLGSCWGDFNFETTALAQFADFYRQVDYFRIGDYTN